MRKSAYFILGKLLEKHENNEALEFYINQLRCEDNHYVLSDMLSRLADIKKSESIDISPIIEKTKSDKWDIRNSAILALKKSDDMNAKLRILEILDSPDEKKLKYAIIYAISVLGTIGTEDDIPLLKKFQTSKIRDIKGSSEFAVETILSRTK